MSYSSGVDSSSQATLGIGTGLSSQLMEMLAEDSIIPGSNPGYQLCKLIYTNHPLGLKMAESPVRLAQSQEREISIPGAPEDDLIKAFRKEWNSLGGIGANIIIRNVRTLSRVYGIASLAVGTRGKESTEPLDLETLAEQELYFNALDPLNTAGSLVLNQDPNSPNFMRPKGITAAGQSWDNSRTIVLMNEQPIWIEWTDSAFGFVGRSVYQRALYPLKSFIYSMITDASVTEKCGLLIMKMKAPGSVVDQRQRSWFNFKRQALKGAKTGNVLSVGIDESVESLNFTNLKDAAEYARSNILKNIATAADMPASFLNQDTMAEGFGEGTEDAKNIARYIDGERIAMAPLYQFIDAIVMHRAWNEDFFKSMASKYPGLYGDRTFREVFYEWKNAFQAVWPNLLIEPDSEKAKTVDIVTKAMIAFMEITLPQMDPENKSRLIGWGADILNEQKEFFSTQLDLDLDALAEYVPEIEPKPREPIPESHEE